MLLPRRSLALGCLLAGTPLRAQVLAQPTAPIIGSLAGQLLVASPGMSDPNFAHAVILMIQQGNQGALGVAINRPVGDQKIADLLQAIGQDTAGAEGTITVFIGGPLQTSIGFIVHSDEYQLPATIKLENGVAVTSSSQVLRDIGTGKGPRKHLLIFGYAGWAPQQLETELSLRVWVTAPTSAELVFDTDRDKLWKAAFAKQTISL